MDEECIREEAMYDGFYAVVTNLEGDVHDVININRCRWEIEENFRIIKTEFKARPVIVKREDSIKSYFLTCYIILLLYRMLEKKLGEEFTCSKILKTLREMNITLLSKGRGYIPSYKRTKLTDALHAHSFQFPNGLRIHLEDRYVGNHQKTKHTYKLEFSQFFISVFFFSN